MCLLGNGMKKLTLYSTSREHFISYATALGKILHEQQRDKPWIIDLNGDFASGKILLALGIDSVYRPDLYKTAPPDGLEAERRLAPHNSGNPFLDGFEDDKPVVTNNYRRLFAAPKATYDFTLQSLVYHNPAARVAIATNVEREAQKPYYNYQWSDMDSDVLDIGIQVWCFKGPTHVPKEKWQQQGMIDLLNTFDHARRAAIDNKAVNNLFWRKIDFFVNDDCPIFEQLQQLECADYFAPVVQI
jgi:hypothetical protein